MAKGEQHVMTKEEQIAQATEACRFNDKRSKELQKDVDKLDQIIADVENLMNKAADIGEENGNYPKWKLEWCQKFVGALVWLRAFYEAHRKMAVRKMNKACSTLYVLGLQDEEEDEKEN